MSFTKIIEECYEKSCVTVMYFTWLLRSNVIVMSFTKIIEECYEKSCVIVMSFTKNTFFYGFL
jgi:hypothetical protein